jgi:hypothetical protein
MRESKNRANYSDFREFSQNFHALTLITSPVYHPGKIMSSKIDSGFCRGG